MAIRISISEYNFTDLVAGKETRALGFDGSKEIIVKIILQDIGYGRMMEIIQDKYLEMKRQEEGNG